MDPGAAIRTVQFRYNVSSPLFTECGVAERPHAAGTLPQTDARLDAAQVIMPDIEQSLRNLILAPYIVKAMALIGIKRRGGSNMFRHQLSTMAILLDYKIVDPVLLKAAVIHDLFEDAPTMPGVTEEEIINLDADGAEVYALVKEVTIRVVDGAREPKAEYLRRVLEEGSPRARLLKLADRISNLTALGFVHEVSFVKKCLKETRACILPHAESVNPDMFRELSDLVENRGRFLRISDEDDA